MVRSSTRETVSLWMYSFAGVRPRRYGLHGAAGLLIRLLAGRQEFPRLAFVEAFSFFFEKVVDFANE
jgi:hypothetical protein